MSFSSFLIASRTDVYFPILTLLLHKSVDLFLNGIFPGQKKKTRVKVLLTGADLRPW